jgi:sortase A
MALKIYQKEYPSAKKKVVQTISYLSLIAGCLMLFWSFYPIISFEIYSRLFFQNNITSPIPRTQISSSLKEASSVLGTYNVYSNNLRDFTQAKLWFPSKPQINLTDNRGIKEYNISIPKLNIIGAHVAVGGEDLSHSLVHYLPMSLPGEFGNVSIFGHSTLPQLYNVKDYKTIFTYLPSLQKGDKVIIKMSNKEYEYEVYDMFIVEPTQISVLEQQRDASYLTLVTCVPPGTFLKRLVVKSKMTRML